MLSAGRRQVVPEAEAQARAPSAPPSGVLDERYDVTGVLASAASCRVLRARGRPDDGVGDVVIKQSALAGLGEDEQRAMVDEAARACALRSARVVQHVDAFLDGGWLHVVCRSARRGDLATLLTRRAGEPLVEEDVWAYLSAVLRGLRDLHEHGLVHRDLKPSNIFIGDDGEAQLGDLGFARIASSARGGGGDGGIGASGGALYAAPELCRGETGGAPADVWAAGCIAYQLACGRPPFLAANERVLCRRIQATEPAELPAVYSAQLGLAIFALLAKQSDRRPTARDVLQGPHARRLAPAAGRPPPSPPRPPLAPPSAPLVAETRRTPARTTPGRAFHTPARVEEGSAREGVVRAALLCAGAVSDARATLLGPMLDGSPPVRPPAAAPPPSAPSPAEARAYDAVVSAPLVSGAVLDATSPDGAAEELLPRAPSLAAHGRGSDGANELLPTWSVHRVLQAVGADEQAPPLPFSMADDAARPIACRRRRAQLELRSDGSHASPGPIDGALPAPAGVPPPVRMSTRLAGAAAHAAVHGARARATTAAAGSSRDDDDDVTLAPPASAGGERDDSSDDGDELLGAHPAELRAALRETRALRAAGRSARAHAISDRAARVLERAPRGGVEPAAMRREPATDWARAPPPQPAARDDAAGVVAELRAREEALRVRNEGLEAELARQRQLMARQMLAAAEQRSAALEGAHALREATEALRQREAQLQASHDALVAAQSATAHGARAMVADAHGASMRDEPEPSSDGGRQREAREALAQLGNDAVGGGMDGVATDGMDGSRGGARGDGDFELVTASLLLPPADEAEMAAMLGAAGGPYGGLNGGRGASREPHALVARAALGLEPHAAAYAGHVEPRAAHTRTLSPPRVGPPPPRESRSTPSLANRPIILTSPSPPPLSSHRAAALSRSARALDAGRRRVGVVVRPAGRPVARLPPPALAGGAVWRPTASSAARAYAVRSARLGVGDGSAELAAPASGEAPAPMHVAAGLPDERSPLSLLKHKQASTTRRADSARAESWPAHADASLRPPRPASAGVAHASSARAPPTPPAAHVDAARGADEGFVASAAVTQLADARLRPLRPAPSSAARGGANDGREDDENAPPPGERSRSANARFLRRMEEAQRQHEADGGRAGDQSRALGVAETGGEADADADSEAIGDAELAEADWAMQRRRAPELSDKELAIRELRRLRLQPPRV